MKSRELVAIRQHSRKMQEHQRYLVELIREARAAGHSLRTLAEVAGVSHEQIRRMTKEDS